MVPVSTAERRVLGVAAPTQVQAALNWVYPSWPNPCGSQLRLTDYINRIMALLLAAVASISLLVGGIGIMNILLVSVTEWTHEIGLRIAVGARRLHVLLQLLAEADFLTVTGGVAGIVLGVAYSWANAVTAGWQAPISTLAIAGGFPFSAVVGVFFGYYPARKAARLNPIEALRYE